MAENPTEILRKILEKMEKIERRLAPPFWKIALKFVFSHFLMIASILGILFFVFKIWFLVGGISENVLGIFEKFSAIKMPESFQFWKN